MQVLVWLYVVQFGTSQANLRQPDIFKHQIYGKNRVLHLGKYGTLKWIFKKWDEKAWTVLLWLRIGPGGDQL
jgi:hypothetical protein